MSKLIRWLMVLLMCVMCLAAAVAAEPDNRAEALRGQYAELSDELGKNQFNKPIYLNSNEGDKHVTGDIYARLDYPFAKVKAALNDPKQGPQNWCDVLILHVNTKSCRAWNDPDHIILHIGSKDEQPLEDAYPVEFVYDAAATSRGYFRVELSAEKGPLSTSDYRILLEAVDIGKGQTFLHLRYAYSYGLAGRLAMKTYLATLGSGKVGFTITDRSAIGEPVYIDGLRGVIERNTMRYYLAIDAYLSGLAVAPEQRLEHRLQQWYSATEKYRRQLHEVSRSDYLRMKRNEYRRQEGVPTP